MNIIHPAIIKEIERRKRESEIDNRLPLYVPVPEREPEAPKKKTEYVITF